MVSSPQIAATTAARRRCDDRFNPAVETGRLVAGSRARPGSFRAGGLEGGPRRGRSAGRPTCASTPSSCSRSTSSRAATAIRPRTVPSARSSTSGETILVEGRHVGAVTTQRQPLEPPFGFNGTDPKMSFFMYTGDGDQALANLVFAGVEGAPPPGERTLGPAAGRHAQDGRPGVLRPRHERSVAQLRVRHGDLPLLRARRLGGDPGARGRRHGHGRLVRCARGGPDRRAARSRSGSGTWPRACAGPAAPRPTSRTRSSPRSGRASSTRGRGSTPR